MSMMVAVAVDLEDPPQQSEMLGQRASSQTVCRFRPRRSRLIEAREEDLEGSGAGVLSQGGRRVWDLLWDLGPMRTVWGS